MNNRYESSGVSIKEGDSFVEILKEVCKSTYDDNVISGVGGFSALYRLPNSSTILSASTDGVGTKLLLAEMATAAGSPYTIGIDLVAMVMNDVLVCGAKPLFMLDCYSLYSLSKNFERSIKLLTSIKEGCLLAGCALIGGETAEMPDIYSYKTYDIAGFGIGIVDEKNLLGANKVKKGDAIIGIESSGPHSNGYSLIRSIFKHYNWVDDFYGVKDRLLKPTTIYSPMIQELLALPDNGIHAMAHITGGGLEANIKRSIPKNRSIMIDWSVWKRPEIFNEIQQRGRIEEGEMREVFNCGISFVLIVDPVSVPKILNTNKSAWVIGCVK